MRAGEGPGDVPEPVGEGVVGPALAGHRQPVPVGDQAQRLATHPLRLVPGGVGTGGEGRDEGGGGEGGDCKMWGFGAQDLL